MFNNTEKLRALCAGGSSSERVASPPMVLCTSYAMSGADEGYAATRRDECEYTPLHHAALYNQVQREKGN
eukprot:2413778-Rhodomonas_salina.1